MTAPKPGDTVGILKILVWKLPQFIRVDNRVKVDIPTFCLSNVTASDMGLAASKLGFFFIAGHGLAPGFFEDSFGVAKRFFELDEAGKNQVATHRSPCHRGYNGPKVEQISDVSEDDRETFVVGVEPPAGYAFQRGEERLLGLNQWPDSIPEMRPTLRHHFQKLEQIADRVMRLLLAHVQLDGVPSDYWLKTSLSSLVAAYYPKREGTNAGYLTCGAHADYGLITLLAQDGNAGLEVVDADGNWLPAPAPVNALLVNIGDCLAAWSGNQYVSARHRVVRRYSVDRMSMPFFLQPSYGAPTGFKPSSAPPSISDPRHWKCFGAYLLDKLANTHPHLKDASN